MTTNHGALLQTPLTPLYEAQVTEWEEVLGYRMPTSVLGVDAEYKALRTAVIAQDYSMLYKWFVEGPDARTTVDRLFSRDVHSIPAGRVAYGVIVDDDGGMLDDVTVSVLSPNEVLVMGGNADVMEGLRAAAPQGTSVRERRTDFAVISVQGPNSRALLQRLTDEDLSNDAFPYYSLKNSVQLAGVSTAIFRLGFTAELGYEVMVGAEDAQTLYEAIFSQTDLGITPFAGGTLMVARIEAGLMLADVDYDSSVSPYECRLGWTVDLDKAEFRGQESLRVRKINAPLRVVSVVSKASPQALEGARLYLGDQDLGVVTMAVRSPTLGGTTLGLARVSKQAAGTGAQLVADIDGEKIPVEVRPTPTYDPERKRAKS